MCTGYDCGSADILCSFFISRLYAQEWAVTVPLPCALFPFLDYMHKNGVQHHESLCSFFASQISAQDYSANRPVSCVLFLYFDFVHRIMLSYGLNPVFFFRILNLCTRAGHNTTNPLCTNRNNAEKAQRTFPPIVFQGHG